MIPHQPEETEYLVSQQLIQDATGRYVYITNRKSIIDRYSYSLNL